MDPPRIALVTGGNRGIGFEICRGLARRGLRVLLGARDEGVGRAAAASLAAAGPIPVEWRALDVARERGIQSVVRGIGRDHGHLDVLVNNAAIYPDEGVPGLEVDLATVRLTMETNAYGPLQLCQAFAPMMVKQRWGRIVNVSSGYGATSEMAARTLAYRISKAALNAMTVILADELRGTGVLVNAMCPGWVHTAMGGEDAPRSPEKGAETAIYLATLPDDGPTGKMFRDRKVIRW
jgi:NAD(P)-dependent dehydrogenase (short-subunit alcohol dehydrogenase family)